MKKKIHKGTGLYAHLATTGVLSTGNDETIKQAKKEYWKQYRKDWKKNKLQQSKKYILLFSFQEARIVDRKATQLCLTPTKYIKQVVLSDSNAIGPVLSGRIREKLILYGYELESMIEALTIPNSVKKTMTAIARRMESQVLTILTPK